MTTLTRADLSKVFGDNPKVISAFETVLKAVGDGEVAQALNVAATAALQDATVITLSPNDTLNNERVLQQGHGISLTDTGSALIIALAYAFYINGGFRLTVNLLADTDLNVPFSGTAMVAENIRSPQLAASASYANDAAAAAGGVVVGQFYRNGSVVNVRVT